MFKKITLATAAALLLSSGVAMADDHMGDRAGAFEFGFNSTEAPVGGRYWFSDTAAFDLGLGFSSMDPGNDALDNDVDMNIAAGASFVVKDFGNAFFFVRPGVHFMIDGSPDPDTDADTTFMATVSLGGEITVNERMGINFQHGLGVAVNSFGDDGDPATPEPDSTTDITTFGANLTSAAVYFRFN